MFQRIILFSAPFLSQKLPKNTMSRGSMDYRVIALLGQFWIIQFRSLIFLSSTILSAVCLAESDLEEDWESHGKP